MNAALAAHAEKSVTTAPLPAIPKGCGLPLPRREAHGNYNPFPKV